MSRRQGVSFFSITCKSCLDSEVLRSWPKSAEDACSVNLRRPILQWCVQMQLVLVKASFLADQKRERSSCFNANRRQPLPCLLPRVIMGPQPALAPCLLPCQTLQTCPVPFPAVTLWNYFLYVFISPVLLGNCSRAEIQPKLLGCMREGQTQTTPSARERKTQQEWEIQPGSNVFWGEVPSD